MSKFVKGAGKGIAGVGSEAMKKAFGAVLGDIIKEILEETGAKDIAKDKLMSSGFKIIGDIGMDPKNIQKELIKNMLKNEFKL